MVRAVQRPAGCELVPERLVCEAGPELGQDLCQQSVGEKWLTSREVDIAEQPSGLTMPQRRAATVSAAAAGDEGVTRESRSGRMLEEPEVDASVAGTCRSCGRSCRSGSGIR